MHFHVICLETSEPITDDNGKPAVFLDGQTASAKARNMSEISGKRWQPRPIKCDDWQARERARFADGTYTRLPWDNSWSRWFEQGNGTAEHFAHVSTKHPGSIAFTENADKGAADVQTPMKPGRYLTRFYGDVLSADEIRTLSNNFTAAYGALKLLFATTADEIERVYVNGPRSCMSHSADDYSSNVHPVRVYAAGDLHLAYLATEEDNHITARVLCWPAKKEYGNAYGDTEKLTALLAAQGYEESDLVGARLLKLKSGSSYVMPYIDGHQSVRDCGDCFKIAERGDIDAGNTNGLGGSACVCPHCDEACDEDDMSYVENESESWCQNCIDNDTFFCEYSEMTMTGDSVEVIANGRHQTWSECAFERHGFQCAGNGNNYPDDECVTLHDGTLWSQAHFDDNGRTCEHCGECGDVDWVCDDCEQETADDTTAEPAARVHVARAGRDESPMQTELELSAPRELPAHGFTIRNGDIVTVRHCPLVPDGDYRVNDADPMHCCGLYVVQAGVGDTLVSHVFIVSVEHTLALVA